MITTCKFAPRSVVCLAMLALTAGADGWGADIGLMSSADRQRMAGILKQAQVLQAGRVLVHLSQTCNLIIKDITYPVLDVRELVPGASFAHGINQIVILNEKLQVEQAFKYVAQLPLYCVGNRLHTLGVLKVNQVDPGGNVLVFESAREQPLYETVDDNATAKAPF